MLIRKSKILFLILFLCASSMMGLVLSVYTRGIGGKEVTGIGYNRIFQPLPKVDHMIIIKQDPEELQQKAHTCGPAVMVKLLKLFGIDTDQDTMEELLHTQVSGTTMLDLYIVLHKFNINAVGMRVTINDLLYFTQNSPSIIYFDNHYALVIRSYQQYFYIFDPLIGAIIIKSNELNKKWKGEALVINEN